MAELNSPSTGIVDAQSGGMIHSESTGIIDETQDDENYHYPRDRRDFRVHDQVLNGGKQ